ncbi:MAG TPA: RodZ domain-containing protein [Paraburkholderia sp.]|uniref:RodZ domain-containing protein n=1 Tax=Paraburkholderia sp. TaxID=1926495 RepID=UPI002BB770DF|nr:RodZ domain-containing protein [Paraburkholderia sp.]HTR06764.1 RodZ domain-containing protein [Paraburkholderia sp.]
MSEPQHPFGTDGTDSNAGLSAQGAGPSPVQAVPDTLAAAGARLAQLREAKGWAIEDVSARLKVSVSKLRELEAGDISHLPDTTFALGVVRAYAKLLGADSTPFTQALRRERGIAQPDLSMSAASGSDLPRARVSVSLGSGGGARASRRSASWLWGVAIIVVAVLALAMWHTNSGESSAWFARLKEMANGASVQPAASSPTVTQGEATGSGGASAVQGADQSAAPASGDANDAANANNAGDSGNAAPEQAAAASAPQVATQVTPQVTPQVTAQVTPQVTAQQPAAQAAPQPAPQAARPAAASAAPAVANAASAARAQAASAPAAQNAAADNGADTSTFTIRVTQDTWVSVRQKDGKEVFSGMIRGSDAREVTGTEPLKVTVGNKAGIESMTIDGQPVDASKYASARGNVARFVLP